MAQVEGRPGEQPSIAGSQRETKLPGTTSASSPTPRVGARGSAEPKHSQPSYQEIYDAALDGFTDDTSEDADDPDDSDDEEQYAALVQEAKGAFSEDERETMMFFLKEKGIFAFMERYLGELKIPASKLLLAFGILVAPELRKEATDEDYLNLLKMGISEVLRIRKRLPQYNSVDDVIRLISTSKRIIVLTGAGISVSCGIPDFRSAQGIYALLASSSYSLELDDPQQMFDLEFFKDKPEVFYSFAHHIYPSNFKPSPSHYFIKLLEDRGKLLRNYTQNIDNLESIAGVKKVLQCHGSFATASCLVCGNRVDGVEIRDDIFAQRVARCQVCPVRKQKPGPSTVLNSDSRKKKKKKAGHKHPWEDDDEEDERIPSGPQAIMKPDITFFGEKLTRQFDASLFEDREQVDLLIIMGTSLRVAPVSQILSHIPHSVPQILINKTPVPHVNPDIILLGESDRIVQHLSYRLGWAASLAGSASSNLAGDPGAWEQSPKTPETAGTSHVWLFEGADGYDKWLKNFRNAAVDPTSATTLAGAARDGTAEYRARDGSQSSPPERGLDERKPKRRHSPNSDGNDADASKNSKKRRIP